MGTAEEAAAAPLEDYIEPDNKVGISVYEIPIDALDKEIPCAAYSRRKKQWYDRTILFHASDIPAESLLITLPDYAMIEEALKLYEQTNGQVLKQRKALNEGVRPVMRTHQERNGAGSSGTSGDTDDGTGSRYRRGNTADSRTGPGGDQSG